MVLVEDTFFKQRRYILQTKKTFPCCHIPHNRCSQVVTTMGASAFSPVLIIKTLYKQTELDGLRKDVKKEISDVSV